MKVRLTNSQVESLVPGAKYYDVGDSEIPGLVVRVQPSGSKIYYLRYKLPDGKRRSFRIGDATALRVAEARSAARIHWADATKGDDPMARKQRPKVYTLRQFLVVYKGEAFRNWHLESIERVKRSFSSILDKSLDEITMASILQGRNGRKAAGKSSGTVNRDLAALRAIFSRAVAGGSLQKNPCDGIKPLGEDTGSKPRYLKPKELERLHIALDKREEQQRAARDSHNSWLRARHQPEMLDLRTVEFTDFLKPMTLLALNSGLRRGELFGLEWDDCELESSPPLLTVRGEGAKSGKTRHIPLNDVALNTLIRWKAQSTGSELVFPSPVTGERFNNIHKSWQDLTDSAELVNFKFHDTRHHFASMLVQCGADLNVVRQLLGHADLKMTLRYAHLAPRNAAEAVALLNVKEKAKKKTNKEPQTADKEETK